jgi:subtilisin family serine protease
MKALQAGPIRLPPDWSLMRITKALSQTVDWSHGFFGLDDAFYDVDCSALKLGILDTGVDTRHPDLKLADALDFTGTDPGDAQGHGTWCLGYNGALPNDLGVLGITGNKKRNTVAQMYSLKVLGNDGSGFNQSIYNGIEAAIELKLDVISCSWGGGGQDEQMRKLFNTFIAQGGYVFCAAGNSGNMSDEEYPAKWPEIPGIAAVGKDGKLTNFSSYGPGVVCCAPGYQMLSTIPGGYGLMSGTSMATPCVAGVATKILAAILAAGKPRPTLAGMVDLLRDFSNVVAGLRVINPEGLLREVIKTPAPPTPVPPPAPPSSWWNRIRFNKTTTDGEKIIVGIV